MHIMLLEIKGGICMEYIKTTDYEYIMNKYHDQSKPFNSFNRFIRHDEIFDSSTGMCAEEIIEGMKKQDEEIKDKPHPIRKAKAFEYVLKTTRISCDKRDIFPAINMVDRPIFNVIIQKWRNEVFSEIIPEVQEKRCYYESNGISTAWPDYDHSVPYWDKVFDLGFNGLLENSENSRNNNESLTDEQNAFYDGIKITYNAIIEFLKRLEEQAKIDNNSRLAVALKNITNNPPATFYEALLMDYIYFMLSEHVDSTQVRSLSNLDRIFYKYYINDLKNGMTEEQIRCDLAYFFLQFTAIDNYWNQPVFFGGCKEDESTEINELSYLCLDVYDKMGIFNPKIQIKIADSTPKEFTLKALDMIRRGNSSIVFVGDATIRKALENVGASPDDARLCNLKGCYEFSTQDSYGCGMNYVNLLKPLEYALHKGCDGISGVFAGRKSPDVKEYKSFDELFDEYKKQLKLVIDGIIETVNGYEDYLGYINPQSMISATYPTCIKKGRDAINGGSKVNNTAMSFGFIADIADSLTAIKKFVFDQNKLTLGELVEILDNDFKDNEKLRLELLADRDKYGNNKDLPDSIANEIVEFACSAVIGRPNAKQRGGKWCLGFHVARQSYEQAPKTASSANGRLRGEELSKNMSASMGMNREGATAAILSITKFDTPKITADACLDLGLLPSAVKGDDGLEAMYALLMTFIKRGGHAMHINVFDADTLRAAQKEPEKYKDLQIRVCGWNVLFNNINKKEQDGFIRQAEGLV